MNLYLITIFIYLSDIISYNSYDNTKLPALNNSEYITLSLDDPENLSYGNYECVAENQFGKDTKIITLKEAFPPPPIIAVCYN